MKTLQNNFTTAEQSKQLLELGLPADSADCLLDNGWLEIDKDDVPLVIDKRNKFTDYDQQEYTPCWSVGRLIEVLKVCIIDKFELEEIFEYLKDCVDTVNILLQIYKEWKDFIDFSKLEE